MRVLITDGNERSALAVTRALGQQQIQVLVGSETIRSLAARSKYCWQAFSYPSPYADAPGFVVRLLEQVKRHQITVVFPMSDLAMQLIGEHRKEFEEYAVVPMPPLAVYEHLSDKYRLMQLASALEVFIPDTLFVPDGCVEAVMDSISHFPVVVKPGRSLVKINDLWRKTSVHYAASAAELRRLYRERDYLQQPSLIQRRVEGQGQGIFALFNQGEVVALFAHRRIREKPPSGGVSVLRESIPLSQPMAESALRLLQHVGWHGVAMVEFKVEGKSGLPLLIEVNGRFWGSLQLAMDAGMDFPYMLYQIAIGYAIRQPVPDYRVGVKTRWLLGDVDHLLVRLLQREEDLNLPTNSPSKLQTLFNFCHFFQPGMHYEVLRLRDIKPFVHELHQYLGSLMPRRYPISDKVGPGMGWGTAVAHAIWWYPVSKTYDFLTRLYIYMIFLGKLQERMIYQTLPRDIRHVLFVCKGNICRSPLAAAYMEARLKKHGYKIGVSSAGLATTGGKEANLSAKAVAQAHGLSLQTHLTTRLTGDLVQQADLILVMEFAHRSQLLQTYPEATQKVFQLGHLYGTWPIEIDDPYGGPPEDFEACYQRLCQSCDNLLQHIEWARENR